MEKYLSPGYYIDSDHPRIIAKDQQLAMGNGSDEAVAASCFTYVRDEIRHSWDYRMNPVTCRASDVLRFGTGYCYAKSHLLAALLRANGVAAGLCYQRLTITDRPPFSLHGLNAIYLARYGWYRVDARGNKEGVAAEFCPPVERLAFALVSEGECDFPKIWSEPHPSVIEVLESHSTVDQVYAHLPDVWLEPRV